MGSVSIHRPRDSPLQVLCLWDGATKSLCPSIPWLGIKGNEPTLVILNLRRDWEDLIEELSGVYINKKAVLRISFLIPRALEDPQG